MTPRPTQYEGLKEKLFWFIISSIGTGVLAMISMAFAMTVDIKVLQINSEQAAKMQEKTWEVATRNNSILEKKADDSTNRTQHHILIEKIDAIKVDVDKMAKKRSYGMGNYPLPQQEITKSN